MAKKFTSLQTTTEVTWLEHSGPGQKCFWFLKILMCLRGKLKKAPAETAPDVEIITSLVLSVRELLLHHFLFKLCLLKSIWDVHSSNISCFHGNLSFEVSSWIYRKTYASQYWKSLRKL